MSDEEEEEDNVQSSVAGTPNEVAGMTSQVAGTSMRLLVHQMRLLVHRQVPRKQLHNTSLVSYTGISCTLPSQLLSKLYSHAYMA